MGDRPTKGVDRWKKSTSSAKATKKKDKAVKPKKTVRVVETEEDDDGFTKVAAKGKTLEITAETLPLRLREVLLARGKKVGEYQSVVETKEAGDLTTGHCIF
jgi:hypothetical protein